MSDLTDLNLVSGTELSESQIQGILRQLDLDILNLARDGKLAAARYEIPGGGHVMDRGANLQSLLAAREHFRKLLERLPVIESSQALLDQ